MTDRYGSDVLADDPHSRGRTVPPSEVVAAAGLVVECRSSGFCGAVTGVEKTSEGYAVLLEDRHRARRLFPLREGAFLIDGEPVTLVRPRSSPATAPVVSASGSRYVAGQRAQVARTDRIWVEGSHDAELVERVWGHDLRIEGVVVEPLHGADDLLDALAEFAPGAGRRVGVLLDHLVPGSKESRLADAARRRFGGHVEIVGHPYVDVWQAVTPRALGIPGWPEVPPGKPWKAGVIAALGWRCDEATAWRRILGSVRNYSDVEPALLGRVEQLIDFVTAERRNR